MTSEIIKIYWLIIKVFGKKVFGTYGGIDWENDKVRFLGVNIRENIGKLNEENFHNTVQKMIQSLHFWKGRYLSRKGVP